MKNVRKHPKIAGIGELLWDILPEEKRLGGAPANFALHSCALGAQAAIVSATGDDDLGKEIRKQLEITKVDISNIQIDTRKTGWVDVELCEEGKPTYVIHKEVAWDYIQTSSDVIELAQDCDAVCFGSLAQRSEVSRNTILKFLDNTKSDCLKILDLNLRQNHYSTDLICNSLQAANILKINDEELEVLQEIIKLPPDTNAALRSILDHYELKLIALTQGAKGSTMMTNSSTSFCPGLKVNVKDTIGAGDSFTAAMTIGILSELPLNTINQAATKVAAYVCSQSGATPTLPEALISELQYKEPIPILETQSKLKRNKTTL